jgi:hypothetical protein
MFVQAGAIVSVNRPAFSVEKWNLIDMIVGKHLPQRRQAIVYVEPEICLKKVNSKIPQTNEETETSWLYVP